METSTAHSAILTCWKDIAGYMGKGVRTVQRWEEQLDLPVHRPNGVTHKSSVVAYPHELDAWLGRRWSNRTNGAGRGAGRKNEITAPPDRSPVTLTSLSTGIRTSHELRHANYALAKEIAAALHALVQSCDQLVTKRQEFLDLAS